jgi:hypothetical protein
MTPLNADTSFNTLVDNNDTAGDIYQQSMLKDKLSMPDYLAYQDAATTVQVKLSLLTTSIKLKGTMCKEICRNIVP